MENSITLIGNAVSEPELRFLPSGLPVTSFGLAVNRSKRNKETNEWEQETSFFDIECRFETAQNVSETITKGARVIVSGRLNQRSWETNEGEKRSKIEVIADEIGPSLRWATAVVTKIAKT